MWLLLRVGCVGGGGARHAAELFQHDRIDARRTLDAALEVLDARPRLEVRAQITGRVSEPRERRTHLSPELTAYRQPALARRGTEVQVVQCQQPLELAQRLGGVVDAQVDRDVGAAVAACSPRDDQGGGLLAAAVA